ncbi:hypothetical protein CCH79_00021142, partial [Gambusia affinis]
MVVIVNVLDINDNAPVFSQTLYKARVYENVKLGTPIIRLNATDLDAGKNGHVTYSFSEVGRGKQTELFEINEDTGTVTNKKNIDYEETNAFEIRVQASDVKEDSAIGTAIALVSAFDKDSSKNGMVNCKISDNIPFKLESNYKNYYSLVVDGPLDREREPYYNICITATDEGRPPLSSTSVIIVHVSDVNDNKPHFTEDIINIFIKENSATGKVIKKVSAVDADIEQNGQISYSILHDNSISLPLSSLLSINSQTGDIISLQSFNYEELKTFRFRVQAADAGVPPLSSN